MRDPGTTIRPAEPVRSEVADPAPPTWLSITVAMALIAFPVVYLASDVLEVIQGGFSTVRLTMTYVGEATIPLYVLGAYGLQRPRIGRLGLVGAAVYAYAYVFFTSTVVYALVAHAPNYQRVTAAFGAWMTLHGLLMVLGGAAFGIAMVRARVLPRWTGVVLVVGVIGVAAASGSSTVLRTLAQCVPAAAFVGMGWSMLSGLPRRARSGHPADPTVGP
jgi:hypothetical protein